MQTSSAPSPVPSQANLAQPAPNKLSAADTAALSGCAELSHMGVIKASGPDAVSFLQGQLTQDVALMTEHQARLAAFCNAKGRMQASFVVFKNSPEELLLVCSRDILPATLKRLSMFVMRAKAKLSDATAEFSLHGLTGNAVASVAQAMGAVEGAQSGSRPSAVDAHWTRKASAAVPGASLVTLPPGAGVARALWCAPVGTPVPTVPAVPLGVWHWLSVQSGVAMITQPLFEALVPQMLNYESVGGVNFKKGCYPGQEVVARSQFRGTLKRRAYVLHSDAAAQPGQEVFHSSDAEQPCGVVASAAAVPLGLSAGPASSPSSSASADAGFDLIVSMQTAAAAEGELTLGSAQGPRLQLLPLPYALLEDI